MGIFRFIRIFSEIRLYSFYLFYIISRIQNCMKSPVEYYIKPWPVRFHQCWTRCPLMSKGPWKPKGLVVCALKCWLAYKAMQNSCDLAGFASADWCWDWISGGAVLLSIHPSIPFPCYYFFLALSLIILFFFLSLVSSLLSFCLHISCMCGSSYLCLLSCVPPFLPFTHPPLFFIGGSIFSRWISSLPTYLWL